MPTSAYISSAWLAAFARFGRDHENRSDAVPQQKLIRLQCYFSPEDLTRMRRHAEKTGVKMAEQLRRAIRAWLKLKRV